MQTRALPAAVLAGVFLLGCQESSPFRPLGEGLTPDRPPAASTDRQLHMPGESVPLRIHVASTRTWVDVFVEDDFLAPDADAEPDSVRVGAGTAFWLLQQEKVVPDLFVERCSRSSLWVMGFVAEGRGTHMGRIYSTGGHCTYPPDGPGALPTYGDGAVVSVAADGDELWLEYENGSSGVTDDPLVGTFRDDVTVVGGTGRFAGAGGEAAEWGTFHFGTGQFDLRMEGSIVYAASRRSRR